MGRRYQQNQSNSISVEQASCIMRKLMLFRRSHDHFCVRFFLYQVKFIDSRCSMANKSAKI